MLSVALKKGKRPVHMHCPVHSLSNGCIVVLVLHTVLLTASNCKAHAHLGLAGLPLVLPHRQMHPYIYSLLCHPTQGIAIHTCRTA